jgi:hypothetical protein
MLCHDLSQGQSFEKYDISQCMTINTKVAASVATKGAVPETARLAIDPITRISLQKFLRAVSAGT